MVLHGRAQEVPAGLMRRELTRSGPPGKLQHLEAVICHAPRHEAIARLARILDGADPARAGDLHVVMHAAHGLLRLKARDEAALAALSGYAERLGGRAGATLAAGVLLLREGPAPLCRPDVDETLLRQSPCAVWSIVQPGPLCFDPRPLCAAWMRALAAAAKSMGAHGHRGFIGDVAEAMYRIVKRSRPRLPGTDLLSEDDRGFLIDTITFELPSTDDFLAARAMVWLLGVMGPPDDAGAAAIERARDRFRNEEFHRDCATILAGGEWPPAG